MTTTLDNKTIGTGTGSPKKARTAGAAKAEALVALRDRLAKATGPDRELSDCISEAVLGVPRRPIGSMHGDVPHYTASLDAAVTLEVPGLSEVVVRRWPNGVYVRWTEENPTRVVYGGGFDDDLAKTEALGRCIVRINYEIAKAREPASRGEANYPSSPFPNPKAEGG